MLPRMVIVPLLLLVGLRLSAQDPPRQARLDTLSLQPITEQPLVAIISGVSEIGGFWLPGGQAALRKLVVFTSSPSDLYRERVFIVLRPFARGGQPIVFELPPVDGARIQNTATDKVNHLFLVEYSRDRQIVRRHRIKVLDPEHVHVEDETVRPS